MEMIKAGIVFFSFGLISTFLVGAELGFLLTVIIGTLYLIYQELKKITSLLRDKASKNNSENSFK